MQSNSSPRALKALSWSILLLVCGYSICYNILGITLNPLIDEFALTGASQGLMSSVMNLGSMIPLVILPLLQGRVSKLRLILLSCALQFAMLLLTGAAANFSTLLVACALLGAGNNFTDSCANSYIVDLHPEDSARYLGLLHGFYGVGGLITPLLISYVLGRSGWRAAYFVAAAVFALPCLLLAAAGLRTRGASGAVSASGEARFSRAMLKQYLRNPRSLLLMGAAALYAASQLGLVTWVARYTAVRFDDAQTGSLCLSAYWICATLCRIFSPRLPFAPSKMLVFGAAGAGVFHALGVLSGSAPGMIVASALVGLVSGLCIPVLLGEAARGNEDRTSLTTASLFLMMGLARMLMPLLMGATADFSIVVAMLLPAGAALLCALLCALARRRASERS